MEHEKEIIQLSGFLEKVPLKTKLSTLEELYKTKENPYSVYELCEALGVARGTFYNHILRRADRSEYKREQKELMLKVQQIFDDSSQRFGAEKIRIILAESGIHVSKKRVVAIMQELDLHSVRPDAKKQFKKRQQYRKQNLLERQFGAEHPNQIWVSDITYFKVNGYWLYFCMIKHSNFYQAIDKEDLPLKKIRNMRIFSIDVSHMTISTLDYQRFLHLFYACHYRHCGRIG